MADFLEKYRAQASQQNQQSGSSFQTSSQPSQGSDFLSKYRGMAQQYGTNQNAPQPEEKPSFFSRMTHFNAGSAFNAAKNTARESIINAVKAYDEISDYTTGGAIQNSLRGKPQAPTLSAREAAPKLVNFGVSSANLIPSWLAFNVGMSAAKESENPLLVGGVQKVEKVFQGIDKASGKAVDILPVSQGVKDTILKPIASLAAQMGTAHFGGKAIGKAGNKVNEVRKGIPPEAAKLATQHYFAVVEKGVLDHQKTNTPLTTSKAKEISSDALKQTDLETPGNTIIKTPIGDVTVVSKQNLVFQNLIQGKDKIEYKVNPDLPGNFSNFEWNFKDQKGVITVPNEQVQLHLSRTLKNSEAPQGVIRSAEGETAQVGTQAVKTAETAVQEPTTAASKLVDKPQKSEVDSLRDYVTERQLKSKDVTEGKVGSIQKANAMEFAAIKRGLEGTPTVREAASARKYLESNHVGKKVNVLDGEAVRPAVVEGNVYGRIKVKFADGTTKSFTSDNVIPKKVTDSMVISHLKKTAEEKLASKKRLYSDFKYTPQPTKEVIEQAQKAPTTPKLKLETDSIGNKIEKNEAGDVVRITGKDGAVKYEASELMKQPVKEAVAKTPKKIPQANTETPVGKQVSDVYKNTEKGAGVSMDLENAKAGSRVFNDGEVTGIKSTFPEWLPEQSRTTPIVNSVLKHLDEGTVPKESAVRVHAAYKAAVEKITGKPLSEFKPKQMVSEADSLTASAPTKTADELAPKPVNPETAKVSKAASDINKSLVAKGFEALPEEEVAKFSSIKKKETLDNVATYIENDLEAAKLAAAGKIDIPNNVHPQVLFNSIAKHAEDVNDYQLLADLAKSPIARARSEAAQTLGASGFNKESTDAVDVIQRISKAKEKAAIKKAGGEKEYKYARKNSKNAIKKAMKDSNLTKEEKSWSKFLDNIKC